MSFSSNLGSFFGSICLPTDFDQLLRDSQQQTRTACRLLSMPLFVVNPCANLLRLPGWWYAWWGNMRVGPWNNHRPKIPTQKKKGVRDWPECHSKWQNGVKVPGRVCVSAYIYSSCLSQPVVIRLPIFEGINFFLLHVCMGTFEGVWLNSALFGVGIRMTLVKLGLHLVLSPAFSTQRQIRCQASWRFPGTRYVTWWSLRAVFCLPCAWVEFRLKHQIMNEPPIMTWPFTHLFECKKSLKTPELWLLRRVFFKCVFFPHVRNLGLRAFGRALQSHGALFYAFSWRAIQGKGFNFHWAWVYPV